MYTLKQVLKSFRGASSIREVVYQNLASLYIVFGLANYTNFRPEQVNILSLLTGLVSAVLYGMGPLYYIPAILMHEISYILDASDGKLARLKDEVTSFGAQLDNFRDKSVHILSLFGLVYGTYATNHDRRIILIGLLYAFLMLSNNYLAFSLVKRLSRNPIYGFSFVSSQSLTGRLTNLRIGKTQVIPIPTVAEWLFIIFVIGPLFNQVLICLILACILVLTSSCFFVYKIISFKRTPPYLAK